MKPEVFLTRQPSDTTAEALGWQVVEGMVEESPHKYTKPEIHEMHLKRSYEFAQDDYVVKKTR